MQHWKRCKPNILQHMQLLLRLEEQGNYQRVSAATWSAAFSEYRELSYLDEFFR